VAPQLGAMLGSNENQAGIFIVETGRNRGSKLSLLTIKIGLEHKDVRFGYKPIMCHPRAQA